jgi:hypothetical protein
MVLLSSRGSSLGRVISAAPLTMKSGAMSTTRWATAAKR